MTELRFDINVDIETLRGIFKKCLDEARFLLIDDDEDLDGGFRMIGVNEKRRSMLDSVMTSLIGGFIPRNRVALELIAHRRDDVSIVILRCVPYMDNADLETKHQSPQERNNCEELARALEKKIRESVGGTLVG
ncbi:hypothetical protein ES703_33570 [subsurface metagenome]